MCDRLTFCVCPRRSSDDQEVLFDQILMGQLEFPLPYWDNVSETAKVRVWKGGGEGRSGEGGKGFQGGRKRGVEMEDGVEDDTLELSRFRVWKRTFTVSSVCVGLDPVHAGGGGRPEIHFPAGAGTPLGQCKLQGPPPGHPTNQHSTSPGK